MMIRKFALCSAAAFLVAAGPPFAADGPSDAQIAHIAYTAGQLDLAAGRQALAKSRNQAVRDFAQTMVRDHAAVNERAVALLKKLGVAAEANATSEALAKQAEEQVRRLNGLSGAAFDKAYAENEVAFHRTVNAALSQTLIPNADNADLKSLLETGLALFQEHQKHAEHLAQSVR